MNRLSVRPWSIGCWFSGMLALGLFLADLCIFVVQITPLLYMASWNQLAPREYAIVLGASVKTPTEPSDALRDRLETARMLYRVGIVRRLLLTGDGGAFRSNEIVVMRNYLLSAGIPSAAITVDEQGFRTYESCKRAKNVYSITHAILVTQRFHLARALYLCRAVGVDVIGLNADQQLYRRRAFFAGRELGASIKAMIDLFLYTPKPPV